MIVQGKVNKPWVWVGCTCGSAYVEKGAEVMIRFTIINDGDDDMDGRDWRGGAPHSCQDLEQNYHLHSP